MINIQEKLKSKPWLGWVIFLVTVLVVFMLGMLASSIVQRRAEAVFAYTPEVTFSDSEPRNALWGELFPREYDSYLKTSDTTFRSKYNGSAMVDMLEESPRMAVLWAGYAFSRDYKQGRGHYHAIEDIENVLRTGAPSATVPSPQPNTCWTCKSPDVLRVMKTIGPEAFYKTHWAGMLSEIVNPIGCANCHNASDQSLRIAQVSFLEAYQRLGKDVTTATLNERRTLVCAQCHVEYYFKGEGKYVTFPWDNGFHMEDIEKYYDEIAFADWIHPLSQTPIIKAQHPDFELFMSSVHFDKGVSCADCHMPYKTEGSQKMTDHKIQSPLNNITNSCMVCHRDDEEELIHDVYERQEKVYEQKIILEDLLVKAHVETAFAISKGAKPEQLKTIHTYIRQAQWRWDFVAASHGGSFHAPLECMRIISSGIEKASLARIEIARLLADLGYNQEVPIPDISTKEKAQVYIGLDPKKMKAEKEEWKAEVLPQWLVKAEARESKMPEPKRIQ